MKQFDIKNGVRHLGVDTSQEAARDHPWDLLIVYGGDNLGRCCNEFSGYKESNGEFHKITEFGLIEGIERIARKLDKRRFRGRVKLERIHYSARELLRQDRKSVV